MADTDVSDANLHTNYLDIIRSEGASGLPQTWSPIMEISMSLPHDEHLIVGRKADCRGKAMLAENSFFLPSSSTQFQDVVSIIRGILGGCP